MTAPKITNQGVAVFAIGAAVGMVFGAFFLSRGDHDLKLMSLQAVLTTVGTLLGIAGTLLVGVQAYKSLSGHDPSELPPGTVQTDTSTVQTPPVTITPPEATPAKPITPTADPGQNSVTGA